MSGPHGSTGTSSSIGGGAGEGGAMPPRPQMGANSSGSNNAGSWSSAGYHHQQHQHQQPQQQQLKQAQGQGVVSPMSALQRLLSLQRGQPLPLPANLVPPKPGGGVGGGSAMASSYQAGIAMNRNKRGFGAVMGGEGVKGMSDSGMSSTSIERREEGMMEGWRGHHQQQQMLSSAGSAAAAFLGTGLRGGKMTMDGSEETGGGGGRGKSMSPMTLRPPTSVEGRGRGVVMSSSNSLSASSEGDREEEEEKEEMGDDYNEELDGDESYSDSVEDGGGANGQKARAARKKAFASLSKEERVERRKEKARLYSHVARRRQESNMRELKAEMECLTVYRLIIEESPDMIVVLHPDLEGRVLFANAAFARGVEAMPGGYMGKPLWAVIHETHRGVVNDAIRNLLMNPETITRLKIQAKYPHPDYPGQGPMMDLTMRHTPTGLVCYMRQA
ncbi:hypothetical protein VYU27_004811 [Nannochloropsis oceanica]